MKCLAVAQYFITQHPFLTAAALAAILLILLWWAAKREASQHITRMPGEDE